MRTHLKRKEVDDVLGGKESWANVDKIEGHVGPPFPPPGSFLPSTDPGRVSRLRGGCTDGRFSSGVPEVRCEEGVLQAAPDPVGG